MDSILTGSPRTFEHISPIKLLPFLEISTIRRDWSSLSIPNDLKLSIIYFKWFKPQIFQRNRNEKKLNWLLNMLTLFVDDNEKMTSE